MHVSVCKGVQEHVRMPRPTSVYVCVQGCVYVIVCECATVIACAQVCECVHTCDRYVSA